MRTCLASNTLTTRFDSSCYCTVYVDFVILFLDVASSRVETNLGKFFLLYSQPQVIKLPVACPYGRWFSPGIPASPTTKTGHHDIAEIFLKLVLHTMNQQSIYCCAFFPSQMFWIIKGVGSCSICINRESYLGILDHLTAD
jgi:hypothetical protein